MSKHGEKPIPALGHRQRYVRIAAPTFTILSNVEIPSEEAEKVRKSSTTPRHSSILPFERSSQRLFCMWNRNLRDQRGSSRVTILGNLPCSSGFRVPYRKYALFAEF